MESGEHVHVQIVPAEFTPLQKQASARLWALLLQRRDTPTEAEVSGKKKATSLELSPSGLEPNERGLDAQ